DNDAEYYKNGITIRNAVTSTAANNSNTFTLTEKPTRVVCLFQGNVELMCMFGLEQYIVGAYVRGADMVCNNPAYQAQYDSVDVTVGATNTWSKETIMNWEPDLIIGWSSSFSDDVIGTIEFWNSIGVNCYRTNLYGNSNGTGVETYYQMLRDIGAMFNKNDEANQFISDWNGIFLKNEQKLKDAGLTERKKVLVIDYKSDISGGTTLVYGTSMLTGNLVKMAGGDCISTGRMDSYTFEEIAVMDFDAVLIVALGYYTSLTQEQHDKVCSFFNDMPAWQHFKEEKPDLIVETLPFYTLYMSGVLKNDCLDDIFNMLYPELSN
ncbi:MAG: ABC transporter substrate-binding protein, partial [archaeon]|nr:ABC transporter substrate-binding protein [archaeon]